jgi:hypothetical protein
MRLFVVSTSAALAFAALLASAPAKADFNYGAVKQGSMCWKTSAGHTGSNGGTFGYWGSCASTASTGTVVRRVRRHHG